MKLGSKQFSAGSVIRYEVDYQYWLENGRTLKATGFSAILLAGAPVDVVISNVTVTSERLFFFITATTVNEPFTVQVQVQDTLNETVIDTIGFMALQA
jgi:hypothetical protein